VAEPHSEGATVQYLILIYEDETAWENLDRDTAGRIMAEHEAFGAKHADRMRGGAALHPTQTASSVRRGSDGGAVVTDGPFAEAKEALGGFYLIEAADLDEALAVAKEVPARFGGVEVRPVRDLG